MTTQSRQASVRHLIDQEFRHFNAASVREAALAWVSHLKRGGRMFLAMGGAMSTAEIGISLAEMIRQGKIHGISTTGANLEEDLFNLVAHSRYKRLPQYRSLTREQELELREQGFNRVTDTCIPEEAAMRKLERIVFEAWKAADQAGERYFPYEYVYKILDARALEPHYEADPKNSWVLAAHEKGIPIFTPGWEDSTMGNFFVSHVMRNRLSSCQIVKSGLEQMVVLIAWYREMTRDASLGFFQIGGGIAGDFPICVVPLIQQDLKEDCKLWGYFAQISDSTTSYGSYSGAAPNEKITWGKLNADTPSFIIESDATIVAPLIFQYVLSSGD